MWTLESVESRFVRIALVLASDGGSRCDSRVAANSGAWAIWHGGGCIAEYAGRGRRIDCGNFASVRGTYPHSSPDKDGNAV